MRPKNFLQPFQTSSGIIVSLTVNIFNIAVDSLKKLFRNFTAIEMFILDNLSVSVPDNSCQSLA